MILNAYCFNVRLLLNHRMSLNWQPNPIQIQIILLILLVLHTYIDTYVRTYIRPRKCVRVVRFCARCTFCCRSPRSPSRADQKTAGEQARDAKAPALRRPLSPSHPPPEPVLNNRVHQNTSTPEHQHNSTPAHSVIYQCCVWSNEQTQTQPNEWWMVSGAQQINYQSNAK